MIPLASLDNAMLPFACICIEEARGVETRAFPMTEVEAISLSSYTCAGKTVEWL